MSLRLVTGGANAGKTGELLREALAAAAAGDSPVLAVPGMADVHRLESELSGTFPLGVRVTTLRNLKLDLWQQHGDGRRVITAAQRSAIVARLLRERAKSGDDGSAASPSLLRFATLLLSKSPECAPASAGSTPAGHPLNILEEQYRLLLRQRGIVEEAWLADLLASSPPRLDGPLGVLHHDAVSADDMRLLVGLARANRVSVALTWVEGAPATKANDGDVTQLVAHADEHVVLQEPSATNEIERLVHKLYGPAGGEVGKGSVVLGLCAGEEAEMEMIARFAAREVACGTQAERIAVAFPFIGNRAHGLRIAMAREGIGADVVDARSLPVTRLGRAALALLMLAHGRGGRHDALTFLASPFSGVGVNTTQASDREWRERRLQRPDAIAKAVENAGSAARTAMRMARRVSNMPEDIDKWRELLDGLLSTAWGAVRPARSPGSSEAEDSTVRTAVLRAVTEMSSDAVGPLDLEDALAVLRSLPIGRAGEEAPGRVQVCDFAVLGSRRFDVLVLAGLTDNEFSFRRPANAEAELLARGSAAEVEDECDVVRLKFYSLVSRARHGLYLVRQETDAEGRELRASPLWDDACDVYRGSDGGFGGDTECRLPVERLRRGQVEEFAPTFTVSRRAQRRAVSDMRFRSPGRESVSDAAALAVLAKLSVFAPTDVEAYLQCPYRWFHERVMRPEQIDADFDNRTAGTYAHRLLATVYQKIIEGSSRGRVTAETLDEALSLADETVATGHGLPAARGAQEELTRARVIAWVRRIIEQDTCLMPTFECGHVEWSFGEERPFIFAGQAFRGRVDRIDLAPEGLFVTDYKLSSDNPGVADFDELGKVQLGVYACAAERAIGRPVVGAAYRSLRRGQLRGFWRSDLLEGAPGSMCADDGIDACGLADLVSRMEERVSEAVAGMRAGRIPRSPRAARSCRFCPVSGLCERGGAGWTAS